jgi:hypothetical protein
MALVKQWRIFSEIIQPFRRLSVTSYLVRKEELTLIVHCQIIIVSTLWAGYPTEANRYVWR